MYSMKQKQIEQSHDESTTEVAAAFTAAATATATITTTPAVHGAPSFVAGTPICE